MELNEMEKKMLFQAEGDCQAKVLNELYMTVRYSNNSELRVGGGKPYGKGACSVGP